MKIGLLGGSFNPAHEGHLHISLEALKRLQLDEIWWLVAPQNPLKSSTGMANYAQRVSSAEALARHPRMRVITLEQQQGLYYTIDTLRFLKRRYRQHRFVWLMGADNLAQFHRWKSWQQIARLIPIGILDRAPYGLRALHGRFAIRFSAFRLAASQAGRLARKTAPCWAYMSIPRHELSASHVRKMLGSAAFLTHNKKT